MASGVGSVTSLTYSLEEAVSSLILGGLPPAKVSQGAGSTAAKTCQRKAVGIVVKWMEAL